jgi:hypothetical protein
MILTSREQSDLFRFGEITCHKGKAQWREAVHEAITAKMTFLDVIRFDLIRTNATTFDYKPGGIWPYRKRAQNTGRVSVGSAGSSLACCSSSLLCRSLETRPSASVDVALTDFFSAFPLA